MHGTRRESWSQASVALRAGAVDVMGGSCAESLDNQSRAVVINAHGSLDRLCWRGGWAVGEVLFGPGLAWVGC